MCSTVPSPPQLRFWTNGPNLIVSSASHTASPVNSQMMFLVSHSQCNIESFLPSATFSITLSV